MQCKFYSSVSGNKNITYIPTGASGTDKRPTKWYSFSNKTYRIKLRIKNAYTVTHTYFY